jgi:hypothetical protein
LRNHNPVVKIPSCEIWKRFAVLRQELEGTRNPPERVLMIWFTSTSVISHDCRGGASILAPTGRLEGGPDAHCADYRVPALQHFGKAVAAAMIGCRRPPCAQRT